MGSDELSQAARSHVDQQASFSPRRPVRVHSLMTRSDEQTAAPTGAAAAVATTAAAVTAAFSPPPRASRPLAHGTAAAAAFTARTQLQPGVARQAQAQAQTRAAHPLPLTQQSPRPDVKPALDSFAERFDSGQAELRVSASLAPQMEAQRRSKLAAAEAKKQPRRAPGPRPSEPRGQSDEEEEDGDEEEEDEEELEEEEEEQKEQQEKRKSAAAPPRRRPVVMRSRRATAADSPRAGAASASASAHLKPSHIQLVDLSEAACARNVSSLASAMTSRNIGWAHLQDHPLLVVTARPSTGAASPAAARRRRYVNLKSLLNCWKVRGKVASAFWAKVNKAIADWHR